MAYKKSRISTIDVPMFDSHMDYLGQSDPQNFLVHNIDMYFTQYPFFESEESDSLSRKWLDKLADTGPI